MCNCEDKVKENFRRKYKAVFTQLERFGYTMVRIKAYTLRGEASKTNKYASIDWKFCPFCGEHIVK